MRAIAIREPFASAIANGEKTIEWRSRRVATGPLLIATNGRAVCVVDVVRISGAPGKYGWHLATPRAVEPFPVRSYGWIVHVDDAAIRFARDAATTTMRAAAKRAPRVAVSDASGPYTFEIDDRKVPGASARTPAGARKVARELARDRARDVAILRDGFMIASVGPE